MSTATNRTEGKEPSGVLIVNKPSGITSHDVVGITRRLFGTRRVGHAGTLDPLASGVLVVLVGRAAKAAEYLSASSKTYRALLRLGLTTDTEDITGQVQTTCADLPDSATVIRACHAFTGEILQIPPMYSALKVQGKKLVDLARRGIEVERSARPVTVFSLTCSPTDIPSDYLLEVVCSGGTYIRTLCADIGKSLGCGGVMAALERTSACGFSLAQAKTLEELDGLSLQERQALLIPVASLFSDLPSIRLPEFYERLCRNGCEIYQKKIGTAWPVGQRVQLWGKNGFFAVGEILPPEACKEPEKGSALKALKLFDLNEA